jgi:hypothetical protein
MHHAVPDTNALVDSSAIKALASFATHNPASSLSLSSTPPFPLSAELTALPKVDTKCTTPSLIPTVNGNTVRSFSTHGEQSAVKGSSTTVSRPDIRFIQYLDSSAAVGFGSEVALIGHVPIHLLPRPATALQLHRGSPLQVHTCSSLQVRAR